MILRLSLILPTLIFYGDDQIVYSIIDHPESIRKGAPSTGIITITVNPINDAPVAVDDINIETDEDQPIVIDVLDNDYDIDSTLIVQLVGAASLGTATISPSQTTITYTPNSYVNGVDKFSYTIYDGFLTASATVTLTIKPVPNSPIAVPDGPLSTDEDTFISFNPISNDYDPDGYTVLTIVSTDIPANGRTSIDIGTNTVTYTPDSNYFGTENFLYQVTDGVFISSALITIIVTPVNDAPIGYPDSVQTDEDTSVIIYPLLNDEDVDGDGMILYGILSGPFFGTISTTSISIDYLPNINYNGQDTITYIVSDGYLQSTAVITINILPINDAPTSSDDFVSTPEDTLITFNPLSNDFDTDLDLIYIIDVSPSSNGDITWTLNSVTFTPNPNYFGIEYITYTISDSLLTSTSKIELSVTPVNDPPVAVNDEVFYT